MGEIRQRALAAGGHLDLCQLRAELRPRLHPCYGKKAIPVKPSRMKPFAFIALRLLLPQAFFLRTPPWSEVMFGAQKVFNR